MKSFNKKEYLIDEEIKRIKIVRLAISLIIAVLAIVTIIGVTAIFKRDTREYEDDIASKRIVNSSTILNSSIENKFEALIYEVNELKNHCDSNTHEGNLNVIKKHLEYSNYSKIGIINDNICTFTDESTDNIDMNKLQGKEGIYSYLSNDKAYLYIIAPFVSSNEYLCAGIKTSDITDFIKSNIYNDTASIILSYKDGTIVSCYNDKNVFKNNVIEDVSQYFTSAQIVDDYQNKLLNAETDVFEIEQENNYMLYKSGVGDNDDIEKLELRLSVFVPKTELIYQLSDQSTLSLRLLYIVLVTATVCILIVIAVNSNLNIQKIKMDSYEQKTNLLNLKRFKHDTKVILSRITDPIYLCYGNMNDFNNLIQLHGSNYADDLLGYISLRLKKKFEQFGIIGFSGINDFLLLLKFDDVNKLKLTLDEFNKKISKSSLFKNISMSFGIKEVINSTNYDIDVIIQKASFAYKMTSPGENIKVFDEDMYEIAYEQARLNEASQDAIINNEFEVFYQPKVNPKTGQYIGAEALVRWKKDGKYISPAKFIPLFEETGFIKNIDYFVVEETCRLIRMSIDNNLPVVPISTNLSKKHFSNNLDFVKDLNAIIDKFNIPHELISSEITEGLIIHDKEMFIEFINGAHKAGRKCSMDDFGSGYSSLNILKELDFDEIKIDAQFFRGKHGFDEESKTIVKTIINLCHDLNKTVIAEGIEDKGIVDFLIDCNCDSIQGFYYSKPIPKNEFIEKLIINANK